MENPLRQNFFRRACTRRCDRDSVAHLPDACGCGGIPLPLLWFVRIGVPLAAILISAGFFFSVSPSTATQAGDAVSLIYAGALILAVAVFTLGIGLLRSPKPA